MQAPGRLSVCHGRKADTSSHLDRRGPRFLAEENEPHCDCHHDDYRQPHCLVFSRCVPRPGHDALLRGKRLSPRNLQCPQWVASGRSARLSAMGGMGTLAC
jgi:hypothetical protein